MARDEIKKIMDASKESLKQDHDEFARSVESDISSYKKRTLDRI